MDCWIVCGTCEEPDREMRCGLKCPEGQGLGEFASSSGLISWKARIAILHSALILETVERDGWLLNYLVLPEPALLFATSAIWMQPGLDGRSQMHPRSHEPAHPSLLAPSLQHRQRRMHQLLRGPQNSHDHNRRHAPDKVKSDGLGAFQVFGCLHDDMCGLHGFIEERRV